MAQNKSTASSISKIKLSPIGWMITGIIIILFWKALLGIGLIILAGFLLNKYQDKLIQSGKKLLRKLFVATGQN